MGYGVRRLAGLALVYCLSGNALVDGPISIEVLEKLADSQNVRVNLPQLPKTVDEVRAVTKRLRLKIDRTIERIVNRPTEAASFANTVLAFDSLMNELDEGSSKMDGLLRLDNKSSLSIDAKHEQQVLAELKSEIYFNAKLYERLNRFSEMAGMSRENQRLLEVMLSYFSIRSKHVKEVIDGWELEGLSAELEKQITRFSENLYLRRPLSFTRAELRGLPKETLAQLKRDGMRYFVDTSQWSEYSKILAHVEIDATRQQVWMEAYGGAPPENNQLIDLILAGRARKGQRLGYGSWAEHNLDSTSGNARGLLMQFARLKKLSASAFAREKRQIAARLGRAPQPWDIVFVTEQMLREAGVDDESVRPYLEFENILDALFRYCETAFGIRIRAISGADLWAEARPFAIFNGADDALLGTFIVDPFLRPGKEPWFLETAMTNAVALAGGTRKLSSALLHASFNAPDSTGKALLNFEEATTLFHEFGHVLQELLPNRRHYFLGPDTANPDLVEFPSVLLETLASEPEVIRRYARHHETGAPMPEKMVQALSRARRPLPAHGLRYHLASSVLDLKLHSARPRKASVVEREVNAEYYYSLPPGMTKVGSFGHFIDYDALSWTYELAAAMAARQIEIFRENNSDLTAPGMAIGVRKRFYEAGPLYSSDKLIEMTLGKSFRLCTALLSGAGSESGPSKN